MILPSLQEGVVGRGLKNKLLTLSTHQLRDYATDKHRHVDDRPYGGGSGMVFSPDIVVRAVRDLKARFPINRVILGSPRGTLLTHAKVQELSQLPSTLILCGRYEGLDQRAIDLVVDEEISIGDYVLSGGELAALVIVDACARLIPGVLGDAESSLSESHSQGLLEYPHYTRPPIFEGLKVPDVLISGNHSAINQWRQEQSENITKKMRPDLHESWKMLNKK